jgi:hypothetical protein
MYRLWYGDLKFYFPTSFWVLVGIDILIDSVDERHSVLENVTGAMELAVLPALVLPSKLTKGLVGNVVDVFA